MNPKLNAAPDYMNRIQFVILTILRWVKFSATRWVQTRISSAAVIMGLSVGLDALIRHVRASKSCSDYKLHGYARLTGAEIKFCAFCSLVAWVVDDLLVELMQDDRVLRNLDKLEQAVDGELQWLSSLDMYVFRRAVEAGNLGAHHRSSDPNA